jgi:hypothetical protein
VCYICFGVEALEDGLKKIKTYLCISELYVKVFVIVFVIHIHLLALTIKLYSEVRCSYFLSNEE